MLADGWHDIRFHDQDGDPQRARALATRLSGGAQLTVAVELDPAERLRNRLLLLLAAGLTLLLMLGLAGSALFGRAIQARLSAINRIAAAVSNGKLDARIPVSEQDNEFDQLGATLNEMLDQNAAHIINLRRVSSKVAHELRTPLMRLRMEEALVRAVEGSGEAAVAERSLADIDAILALFTALLRIAEVEAGGLRAYFQPVNLSDVVEALVESYTLAAEDGGRHLHAIVQTGVVINGDSDLLAQIVVNLAENALRHTPAGARVCLTLSIRAIGPKCEALLMVADDGPGIAEADRSLALQPFEKLGCGGSGHGLGLNLVCAIVSSHGGMMALEDNQPGLVVRITLPYVAEL